MMEKVSSSYGGPLTSERLSELGIVKLNDYLAKGTRSQFWEEHFVKVIMHVSTLRRLGL